MYHVQEYMLLPSPSSHGFDLSVSVTDGQQPLLARGFQEAQPTCRRHISGRKSNFILFGPSRENSFPLVGKVKQPVCWHQWHYLPNDVFYLLVVMLEVCHRRLLSASLSASSCKTNTTRNREISGGGWRMGKRRILLITFLFFKVDLGGSTVHRQALALCLLLLN